MERRMLIPYWRLGTTFSDFFTVEDGTHISRKVGTELSFYAA